MDTRYLCEVIKLYILTDVYRSNGWNIPDIFDFLLSTDSHTILSCLISKPLHHTEFHVLVRMSFSLSNVMFITF